ncbi:MAG: hypothetical protein GXP27_07245 [Planctomycetes bacterium]|nr:hypothetical protein [Planctomycetota bacterium]
MYTLAPQNPKDRFEVYRFFNGLSEQAKEGLDARRPRVPLVKTFLLEHVSSRGEGHPKPADRIFEGLGANVRKIDESFMSLAFEITDPVTKKQQWATVGFLEQYDERFFAYYTCEESVEAKKRVRQWILSPDLDAAWFSSPLLQVLWDRDVSRRGDNRFSKLVFRHESIFDMPGDFVAGDVVSDGPDSEREEPGFEDDVEAFEDRFEIERRKARFEMGDRIGQIRAALQKLQNQYSPLNALYALKFPSLSGRGSHELYQYGQVTNRTDSFEDHRNTVRYLYRIYKSVVDITEEHAWPKFGPTGLSTGLNGVPLIVRFDEELSEATFNRWMELAFRRRNRFKLWGRPIRLGPRKVHVYGADRHLWQPINLEITSKYLVAILPHGTCGNTFHRLVANIQHYVCPKIRAWIGEQPFEEIVGTWSSGAGEDNES